MHLISKVIENENINESNYTNTISMSLMDYYLIVSMVIKNGVDYIFSRGEQNICLESLDYEEIKKEKNLKIDKLNEQIDRLTKENDLLKYQLRERKTENSVTKEKSKKKKNEEYSLAKENALLQEEITSLKTILSEYEQLIELRENQENETLALQTDDRILFVGGHENELRKLKFTFPNSDALTECSKNFQMNYIGNFDYIVFLTHYMSHSLYYKVKGVADTTNVPYLHCAFNNVSLILKFINENRPIIN